MTNRKLMAVFVVGSALAVGGSFSAATAARSNDRDTQAQQSQAAIGRMPPESAFRAGASHTFEGKTWRVGRSANELGQQCLELRSPAGWRSGTCLAAADTFASGQILAYTGVASAVSFVHGVVAPAIKTLELIRADCSVHRVGLSADGQFVTVAHATTAGPWQLRGSDRAGRVIETEVLTGRAAGRPASGGC